MAKENVNRRFFYYGVKTKYVDFKNTEVDSENISDTLIATFKKIQKLRYSNNKFFPNFLLYQNTDGDYVYIKIDYLGKSEIRFRLLFCRDKLLPYIEENGSLKPLYDLFDDKKFQKMAEITHCIMFLETNTLAVEYNFAGAKVNDLALYLTSKAGLDLISTIEIYNLVNINVLKKLKHNSEMSLFDIRVDANSEVISELIKEDDTFRALKCGKENVDQIEFVMRRRVSKKKTGFVLPFLTGAFVEQLFKNYKSDFGSFKVKYGYGTEVVDLLADNYICKEKFVPIARTKTIESEDAYNAMRDYYISNVKKYREK